MNQTLKESKIIVNVTSQNGKPQNENYRSEVCQSCNFCGKVLGRVMNWWKTLSWGSERALGTNNRHFSDCAF